jgi:hypothetical protein
MLKIEKTLTYCVRDNHRAGVVQSDARAIAIGSIFTQTLLTTTASYRVITL